MIPFSAPKIVHSERRARKPERFDNQRNATTETARNQPTKQIDKQTNKQNPRYHKTCKCEESKYADTKNGSLSGVVES
jgi:hypothetical protein